MGVLVGNWDVIELVTGWSETGVGFDGLSDIGVEQEDGVLLGVF